MPTPAQLVAKAKEMADMTEADPDGFVSDSTWLDWGDDGIRELHDAVANCFKATFFRETDFVLPTDEDPSGPGRYRLPTNIKRVKGIDIDPGTVRRRTVRPANFGDRNSLRGVGSTLAIVNYCRYRRYTVLGSRYLQIQPQEHTPGNYRLYWVPQATTFGPVKTSVRVAATLLPSYSTLSLPMIHGTISGALPAIDGVSLEVGDRVLYVNDANVAAPGGHTPGAANGIYEVTQLGDGLTAWQLTRVSDYDANTEIAVNDLIAVQEGTTYAHTFWQNTGPTINVDVAPMLFSQPTTDEEINPYIRYVELFMARQANLKEDDFDSANAFTAQMNQIREDMKAGLENDEGGPSTIVDIHGDGSGWW
jgi:hypothetical protein